MRGIVYLVCLLCILFFCRAREYNSEGKVIFSFTTCDSFSEITDVVTQYEVVPPYCWKISPQGESITLEPSRVKYEFSLGNNSFNCRDGAAISFHSGLHPTPGNLVAIFTEDEPPVANVKYEVTNPQFVIFLNNTISGISAGTCTFNFTYTGSQDEQYKTSVLLLIGIVISLAVPGFGIAVINGMPLTRQVQYKIEDGSSRKKQLFYVFSTIGILVLALLVTRTISL